MSKRPFERAQPSHRVTLFVALALAQTSTAIAADRIAPSPTGIGTSQDYTGSAAAISGDTVAVGIPRARPDFPTESGAVGVYRAGAGGWQREAILAPPDPVDLGGFGAAVSIEQDTLVTSGGLGTGSLAIYTFERSGSTWSLTDEFSVGPDALAASFSGNTLVVSAWNDGAKVFTRSGTTWALQTALMGDQQDERIEQALVRDNLVALVGSNGSSMTRNCFVHFYSGAGAAWTLEQTIALGIMGTLCDVDVAISGQTALVSAGDEGFPRQYSVNAYVRDQGTWSLQGPLDAGADYHSVAVAIDGDRAIVGSPGDDLPGIQGAGTAYVFERSNGQWSRTQHLYDPAAGYQFGFGSAVALAGDTAVVGSPLAFTAAGDAGKASVLTLGDAAWTVDATLDDGDAHAGESFGTSIAAAGPTLVAGAPVANTAGGTTGAVYVFGEGGGVWSLDASLYPTPAQAGEFGYSLALDGDTLAVGAPQDDDARGAAYVFTREAGAWSQAARITLGNDDQNEFGESVALGGGWLFAGEPGQDYSGSPQTPPGQVHVYAGSGSVWTDQGVLTPSVSNAADEFGYAMALSGDTLLVGAARADDGIETEAGAVFVFVNSGSAWTEEARLDAPVPASDAGFGVAVAIAGDTAVIGAGANYELTSPRGAAYVFHRTGGVWTWEATLVPAAGTNGGYGHAVAVCADETRVTVGMPHTSDGPGRVFTFQKSGGTWIEGPTLQGIGTPLLDQFGLAVAFDGSDALVGAPADNPGGAVYVFGVGDAIFAASFDP